MMDTGQEAPELRHPGYSLRGRTIARLFLAIFALITLIWVAGNAFVASYALGSDTLMARRSDTEITAFIKQHTDGYKLAVRYPDKSQKEFALEHMGFRVNSQASIEQARRERTSLQGRLQWWKSTPVAVTVTPDREVLRNFVSKDLIVAVQSPQDATLSVQGGTVRLSEAVSGKQYGLYKPERALETAVGQLQRRPLELASLPVTPKITSKGLEGVKGQLEGVLSQSVVFEVAGSKVTASSADVANWIELGPNPDNTSVVVTPNSGKILAYINEIARGRIRPAKNEVVVKRADGSSFVLVKGVTGVDITDKEATAASVASSLLKAQGTSVPLKVRYSPYKVVDAVDADKWIEVDITAKRMYAYERDKLVKTFLVSAGAPATPTVTGTFRIYAKYAAQDMRGNNVDGTRYFQPNVQWVSYFYKDYAIHGNYWRPLSYFGNINSSHGCVGTVNADSLWIYEWAPMGTPVVVHS